MLQDFWTYCTVDNSYVEMSSRPRIIANLDCPFKIVTSKFSFGPNYATIYIQDGCELKSFELETGDDCVVNF